MSTGRDFGGMTAGLLIEMLQGMDPETPVGFSYPSGDHWRTQVVGEVTQIEERAVEWSAYHEQFALPRGDDAKDEEPGHPSITIVVLS